MNSEILERLERIKKQEIPTDYEKGAIHLKPKEWLEKSLDKIIISSDYGTSESTNNELGIPVLRMGNMNDGKIDISDVVYLELNKEQFEKLKLNKGDILFNRTNSYDLVGKVSLFDIDGDYVCASYIVRFKIDNSLIDSRYVSYFMNLPKSQQYIKMLATKGVQQANVNPTTLKKYFKISFPKNLDEQKYILDILDTWEQSLKLKEKLLEEKQKQKKGIMEKLLTGKIRITNFTEEWKQVKLGSIMKERKEIGYNDLELLAITSANGVVRRTEVDIKDTSSDDKSKYKRILPGDIGYNTMRMWQGVSGLSKYEGIVSPAYTILKPTDKVDSEFMAYLFKLPKMISIFHRNSQGLVSDTLNLKYENFKGIKVNIPMNIEEQKAIAQILRICDKEIELLQKEIELLKEQKKGIMKLLLTGIVRVKCD